MKVKALTLPWREDSFDTEALGRPRGSEENAHETESRHWVVLGEGGAVIACCMLHVREPSDPARDDAHAPVGKLMQMAVEPALAGQGLGRTLVEAVFAEAARAGCVSVVLHARETAAGFYARCGCLPEGEPFTEVGPPHRRMRWRP